MVTERERNEVSESIPSWLLGAPIDRVIRIDVGLEGNWSETVKPVWSPDTGFTGFDEVVRSHVEYRPALEFCLADEWIGIRCCQAQNGLNVLDEEKARRLIEFVESFEGRTS